MLLSKNLLSTPINQSGLSWTSDLQVVKYDYSDQKNVSFRCEIWGLRPKLLVIPSHLFISLHSSALSKELLEIALTEHFPPLGRKHRQLWSNFGRFKRRNIPRYLSYEWWTAGTYFVFSTLHLCMIYLNILTYFC